MGQLVFATLVGVGVRLLASGTTPRPGGYLAWVLVAFALIEFLVAAVLSVRPLPGEGRRAALSTTLLVGTLLGSVAWFLALALATEQRGAPLYVLLLILSLGYALGFLVVSRLAKAAAKEVSLRPGADG